MYSDLAVLGDVVLTDRVLKGGALEISGGRIARILEHSADVAADTVIDHSGKLILAGGIDAHVHAYSSGVEPEGLGRLTRGAAAGGVTTVLDMPYDRPEATTTTAHLDAKQELVRREALVDVGLYATLPKFGGAERVAELARHGASAFKLSTYETDPVRFPSIPTTELMKNLPEIAKTGLVAVFHAEDGEVIDPLVESARQDGANDDLVHARTRPLISETLAVIRLLELAREYGFRLHIAHLTSPRAYEVIRRYRDEGVDVTAETCIQYLAFDDSEFAAHRAFAKCNPPLRTAQVREELWDLVLAGEVDFVTSDHAPWPESEKNADYLLDNSSGLPGVETILPVLYSEGVVKRGLSLPQLTQLMSAGPARRFGLAPRKGVLAVGADADIAVLDPDIEWTISTSDLYTVADRSPYDGLKVSGKVVRTLVRGTTVFEAGKLTAEPGYGQFQRPVR